MIETGKLQDLAAGYALVKILGRGGYGEVWEAIRLADGSHVALKFARIDREEKRTRPEFEILNYLKSIDHPHIIRMFDIRREYPTNDPEGWLVVEMEIAQESLHERFERIAADGRPGLPRQELIDCLSAIALTLDFLNERRHAVNGEPLRSLVHADLKPQNILLVGGTPKLADFGVSKLLEQTHGTRPYGIFPYCTPPEAYLGATGPGYDQYSLAISYCKLLGGRWPFDGSPAEIQRGHTQLDPDLSMIPDHDRGVVSKALEKGPGNRWKSCSSFIEELRRSAQPIAVDGLPAVAPFKPTLRESAQPLAVERRRLAFLIATAGLLLFVAFAWLLFELRRSDAMRQQEGIVAIEEENARAVAQLEEQVAATKARLQSADEAIRGLTQDATNKDHQVYLANRRLLESQASLSMSRLDDLVGRLRSWANSFRIRLLTELQVMALRNRLDRSTLELKQVEKQAQEYKAKSDSDRLALARESHRTMSSLRKDNQDKGRLLEQAKTEQGRLGGELTKKSERLGEIEGQLHSLKTSYSRLGLERGVLAFEQKQSDLGLLWLARAYNEAPENSPDLKREILGDMATWYPAQTALRTILPHRDRVSSSAFSPDGKLILTGCWDGTAQLWDRSTGLPSGSPLNHNSPITAVGFCPDGQFVVTGAQDGVAKLWNITNEFRNRPVRLFEHENGIRHLAISPDGKALVTASTDRARIWSIADGAKIGQPILEPELATVAFSADGKTILIAGASGAALIDFRVDRGSRHVVLASTHQKIRTAAMTPDGRTIAAVRPAVLVHERSFLKKKEASEITWALRSSVLRGDPNDRVAGIRGSSRERVVCELAWVNARSSLALDRSSPLLRLVDPAVTSIAFSPDGWHLACGTSDGKLYLYSFGGQQTHERVLRFRCSPVTSVAFSPDGDSIVTTWDDGTAGLWDVPDDGAGESLYAATELRSVPPNSEWRFHAYDTGRTREELFKIEERHVPDVAIQRIDSIISANKFRVIDRFVGNVSYPGLWEPRVDNTVRASDDAVLAELVDPASLIDKVAMNTTIHSYYEHTIGRRLLKHRRLWLSQKISNISPDGSVVVKIDATHCRKADAYSNKLSQIEFVHEKEIRTARIRRDGKVVATGGDDNTATLWDAATGKKALELKHIKPVTCVDFDPEGTSVATGCEDNQARIWDVNTGTVVVGPLGHPDAVTMIRFSPDGKTLLTKCQDGAIRLWDRASAQGRSCQVLPRESEILTAVFSPDGQSIVTAASDGRIQWRNVSDMRERWSSTGWRSITGRAAQVTSIDFTPDGKYLILLARDDGVQYWDVALKKRIGPSSRDVPALVTRDGPISLDHPSARWIRAWAECLTLKELNDHDTIQELTEPKFRERVKTLRGQDLLSREGSERIGQP